jgi:hypothetical protein
MTGRRFRRWICHGQPSLHTLHLNANRPSIKAAFEEKNTSAFGIGEEIGAQSLREMWRDKKRPKRRGAWERDVSGESKLAAQEDSSLQMLV